MWDILRTEVADHLPGRGGEAVEDSARVCVWSKLVGGGDLDQEETCGQVWACSRS